MVAIKNYIIASMTSIMVLVLSACDIAGVHATTVFYKYGHTTFKDFATVNCDLVDGDITAIVYDGKRVDIKNDGKDVDRLKTAFPFFYTDQRDAKSPTATFFTVSSAHSARLSQNFLTVVQELDGHLSFVTSYVNLGGGKSIYPVQIEFRGHLITFPVKKEDLEKMLGKPDSIEERKSYAA